MNRRGDQVSPMEHRAGWDATFSAPKSVSLTALVGGDDRVREAHRESVAVALDELERYTQARLGGELPSPTNGQRGGAELRHQKSGPPGRQPPPHPTTPPRLFHFSQSEGGQAHSPR